MAKRFSWSLRKTLQIEFDHALLHRLFLTAQPDGLQMTIENPAQTISAADRNKTVVVSREGSLTVDGLIRELGAVSESARRWTRSEENFEDLVAGLVIRNHCLREAKREKLDQSLQVEQEVAWAFDTHLLDAFERELKEQFTVSADSVKSYYDEHKELFRSEPEVRLSGILLGDAVVSDSLRRLLEQGIPFEALARTYSIQRQTASSGGDLGYLRRRDLGRFAKDMFSLKQDAWAGPFTDDGKYLFVKRTGLKEPAYRSYEDCESEIRATIGALSWEANRRRFIESSGVPVRVFSQKLAGPFLSSSNP